jgi:hypothetical protein
VLAGTVVLAQGVTVTARLLIAQITENFTD